MPRNTTTNDTPKTMKKTVIDGMPANAFRVVAVGQDIVMESFYLYPDFASAEMNETYEFNLDPDTTSEPNFRMILNREVAFRLSQALLNTLGVQVVQAAPTVAETARDREPITVG